MQSFLDALKNAPNSSQVKINVFLASFNPNARVMNVFLEGKHDPSFIRVHSSRMADEKQVAVETTILGCKKDVLDAWKFLGERFPENPRLLFFVDKDHDELLGITEGIVTKQNLFVTCYYSIENYLVSEDAIRLLLIDIWGLDSTVAESASKHFSDFQDKYRTAFLPWMAWHITARRLGHEPKIKKIPISTLSVDPGFEPRLKWDPNMHDYLASKCKVPTPICSVKFQETLEELEKLPTKVWLRGKQEIWCLLAFLNELVRIVEDSDEISDSEIKRKLNIGNILDVLPPRLACPEDLKMFLEGHLELLVNSSAA